MIRSFIATVIALCFLATSAVAEDGLFVETDLDYCL